MKSLGYFLDSASFLPRSLEQSLIYGEQRPTCCRLVWPAGRVLAVTAPGAPCGCFAGDPERAGLWEENEGVSSSESGLARESVSSVLPTDCTSFLCLFIVVKHT